ncbi:hypothetical protein QBC41DRAFT_320480 [Cercophora samala]|uniref:Uncharacterized protein n=1 Tax=Cercophora samala TaxID=330535 RepID=A0AA39ZDZ9_9PEZI|nr:hypothetical protein QBC41DRAFT_320480 [Cercophora samala]
MVFHLKPGYIGISEDIAHAKLSSEYLGTKLARFLPPSAPESEALAISAIVSQFE